MKFEILQLNSILNNELFFSSFFLSSFFFFSFLFVFWFNCIAHRWNQQPSSLIPWFAHSHWPIKRFSRTAWKSEKSSSILCRSLQTYIAINNNADQKVRILCFNFLAPQPANVNAQNVQNAISIGCKTFLRMQWFTKIIIGIIRSWNFQRWKNSLLSCFCIHAVVQFAVCESTVVRFSSPIALCNYVGTVTSCKLQMKLSNYEAIVWLMNEQWTFSKEIFIVQRPEFSYTETQKHIRKKRTMNDERWNEIHSFFRPFLFSRYLRTHSNYNWTFTLSLSLFFF